MGPVDNKLAVGLGDGMGAKMSQDIIFTSMV